MSALTLSALPSPSSQMAQSADMYAFSGDAQKPSKDASQLREDLLNFLRRDFFDELTEARKECSTAGWDGYGAKAIPNKAFNTALCLIKKLPLGIQTPELSPAPDGRLGLEWFTHDKSTLVLEPSEDGKLHYVALLSNGDKVSGTTVSDDEIPEIVIQILARHFRS